MTLQPNGPSRATGAAQQQAPAAAQADATNGGFTRAELDLIHATAAANGVHIDICSAVVPDDAFPHSPGGGLRPEVTRILAGLRRDSARAARPAGFGTLADRTGRGPADRTAFAVAYDRDAHDLEASHRLAVAAADEVVMDAIAGDGTGADRG